MTPSDQSVRERVWFITGCSTGFGRELAKMVLDRGYSAVVTARDPAKVEDIANGRVDRALVLELDVTDPVEVDASVKSAAKHFGLIDVLVNNAGIGYFGAAGERRGRSATHVRDQLLRLVACDGAVLPIMRQQRSGHIVNISGIGGLRSFPTLAYYNATKTRSKDSPNRFRSKSRRSDQVTIVEPSGFRTDWAGRSAAESKTRIADYARRPGRICRI
jgi:NADP-dependent 3-hydroxy acid dehydrogenase YdfG